MPFAAYRFIVPITFAVIVFGVLWAEFTRNHRRLESRISARLAFFAKQGEIQQANLISSKGENAKSKILVPVDGSRNSQYAVRQVANEFLKNPAMEIHLLNVQAPFSSSHLAILAQEVAKIFTAKRRKRR